MSVLELFRRPAPTTRFNLVRRGGKRLADVQRQFVPPRLPVHDLIEQRAQLTHEAGQRPLWDGYKDLKDYPFAIGDGAVRTAGQVSTTSRTGPWFTWLAQLVGDPTVVEFGTAFGSSGMYWLAGIGRGHLYTFDPNTDWAGFARKNLESVSDRFTLTLDTFESAGPKLLEPGSVDIGFIDAIHTKEFVDAQYEILRPMMKPGGIVLFDDIQFSRSMKECWSDMTKRPEFVGVATIGGRVGVAELA